MVFKYSQKSMLTRSTSCKKIGTSCIGLGLCKFISCLKFLSERYDNESFMSGWQMETRQNIPKQASQQNTLWQARIS